MSNELAVQQSDITVSAETPQEMVDANHALIQWCTGKINSLRVEKIELEGAYDLAKQGGWKSSKLKLHAKKAGERIEFYQKFKTALERGYYVVPSFPVTAFAIRTENFTPEGKSTTDYWVSHTQETESLPVGEGDYKNPFPVVSDYRISAPTHDKAEVRQYWASAWKELDFPLAMAKPRIMEATNRAMALKIFDDIGILPGFSPNEKKRAPQGDPIIVARIKAPKSYHYQEDRFITFIVAWALDTKTLP